MNTSCCCKPHDQPRRPLKRAAGVLLPGLMLVLMPKCPMCLAAYVTLLTGLSVSATMARPLHVALMIACVSVLALTFAGVLRGLRR